MTLQTKVINNNPTTDANGSATTGGSITIVTTDNGDGKSGLAKVYKNELGQTVIDTRGVDYTAPYGNNVVEVTQQAAKVNTVTATFHPDDAPENANVIHTTVMTLDTRPKYAEEKPIVMEKVGNAEVPTVQE